MRVRVLRAVLLTLGLLAGLALVSQAEAQSKLALDPVAVRRLTLDYAIWNTKEFGACGIGRIAGDTVYIERVVPQDMSTAADSSVVPLAPCLETWGLNVVATIHSHPGPDTKCSHFLFAASGERLSVGASDWHRFKSYSKEAVSVIWCGDRMVWLNRAGEEYGGLLAAAKRASPARNIVFTAP